MPSVPKIDFGVSQILDAGAEFVAVINEQGRVEEHACKNGIPLDLGNKEVFFMGLRLQSSLQTDFDDFFGSADYTVTRRGNRKFVSIPFYSKIIFAILDKENNHHNFVRKIVSLAKPARTIKEKLSKKEEMNN